MGDLLENFITAILSSINAGGLSACLAVVASLYVPVAILIYQELNEQPSFNSFRWDKTVLLQKVTKGWQILGAVLLSSITTIFWECKNNPVKLFLLSIFIIGIVILVKNLVCLFKWFMSDKVGRADNKNYRQEQKIKFLKELDPNNSLDVWSDLFSSIELENAFLKDYLRIFFNKFSEAKKDSHWQYELCITQNMERLYYQNPDFQNEVINFAFDAYINDESEKDGMACLKRTVVRELFRLLSKGNGSHYFSISEFFDRKLDDVKSNDLVLSAVRNFSSDALIEIASVYDSAPRQNDLYNFAVFPIDKWDISALLASKNEKRNAKAMGLFISYLEALPQFVGSRSGEVNYKRATFLDEIAFGMANQKFSRKMIRIINLYFSQVSFELYENEDIGHALIRSFIDNDYRFLFTDMSCSVSSSFNPDEPEEQKIKRIMKKFKEMEKQRDNNTIELLTNVYSVLLDTAKIETISKAISDYNLDDEKYLYNTDKAIVKSNFEDLKSTIDKVIEYRSTVKSPHRNTN